jgi:hypothetical protein
VSQTFPHQWFELLVPPVDQQNLPAEAKEHLESVVPAHLESAVQANDEPQNQTETK